MRRTDQYGGQEKCGRVCLCRGRCICFLGAAYFHGVDRNGVSNGVWGISLRLGLGYGVAAGRRYTCLNNLRKFWEGNAIKMVKLIYTVVVVACICVFYASWVLLDLISFTHGHEFSLGYLMMLGLFTLVCVTMIIVLVSDLFTEKRILKWWPRPTDIAPAESQLAFLVFLVVVVIALLVYGNDLNALHLKMLEN